MCRGAAHGIVAMLCNVMPVYQAGNLFGCTYSGHSTITERSFTKLASAQVKVPLRAP